MSDPIFPAPIALTSGDPSGIGLEISLQAWEHLKDTTAFFLIADPRHLPDSTPFQEISDPAEAHAVMPRALPVLTHSFPRPAIAGQPAPENAKAVIDVIARAVDLAKSGAASAVVTNPIHKKALKDGAGFAFPGHTEFLASLCGVERVVMMLAAPDLKVVPVTIHISLSQVRTHLTADLIKQTIRITHSALQRDFGVAAPRIAVAGLNPHAGEGGVMGLEEITLIAPALAELAAEGITVTGPHSADTMFHARARARYDVAVCMYHDQALIPVKTLDFDRGVNVTLGLPIIRTSPDHGTAYDIAGKGIARPDSLIQALRLAAKMALAGGR